MYPQISGHFAHSLATSILRILIYLDTYINFLAFDLCNVAVYPFLGLTLYAFKGVLQTEP